MTSGLFYLTEHNSGLNRNKALACRKDILQKDTAFLKIVLYVEFIAGIHENFLALPLKFERGTDCKVLACITIRAILVAILVRDQNPMFIIVHN